MMCRAFGLRNKHGISLCETLVTKHRFHQHRERIGKQLVWKISPPEGCVQLPAEVDKGSEEEEEVIEVSDDSETEKELDENHAPGRESAARPRAKGAQVEEQVEFAVRRRHDILRIVQTERAAPVSVIRALLQKLVIGRAERVIDQLYKIDEKGVYRYLQALHLARDIVLSEIPWPGKGAGNRSVHKQDHTARPILLARARDATDEEVAEVLRNLRDVTSSRAYLRKHCRTKIAEKRLVAAAPPNALMVIADREAAASDSAEQQKRLRALELSLGFIPSRAIRAKLFHSMLLSQPEVPAPSSATAPVPAPHAPERPQAASSEHALHPTCKVGDAEARRLSLDAVLERLALSQVLLVLGINEPDADDEVVRLADQARLSGAELNMPIGSLSNTLQELLVHSRLANSRLNDLLRILKTLGLVSWAGPGEDEVCVALEASIPSAMDPKASECLRLDDAQGAAALWERLQGAVATAVHAEAGHVNCRGSGGAMVHAVGLGRQRRQALTDTAHSTALEPPRVPAANGGVIPPELLRASQWVAHRKLTNWQRHNLREADPQLAPSASYAQLADLAASLVVHPSQLQEYLAEEAAKLEAKAIARSRPRKRPRLACHEEVDEAADGDVPTTDAASSSVLFSLDIRGGGTRRRAGASAHDGRTRQAMPARTTAVTGRNEAHAEDDWVVGHKVIWNTTERRHLLDAFAGKLAGMLHEGDGAADAHAGTAPLAPGVQLPLSDAIASAAKLVNWASIGASVGRSALECRAMIHRLMAQGESAYDLSRHRRVKDTLSALLTRSPPRATSNWSEAAHKAASVARALGIELFVDEHGALLPRVRDADNGSSPRQAALRARVLVLLAIPDTDYCGIIGTRMLEAFSGAETDAILTSLLAAGWVSGRKYKAGQGASLKYKLSAAFHASLRGVYSETVTSQARRFLSEERRHGRQVSGAVKATTHGRDVPLDISAGAAATLIERMAAGEVSLIPTLLPPEAEQDAVPYDAHDVGQPALGRQLTNADAHRKMSVRLHLLKHMHSAQPGTALPRLAEETAKWVPRPRIATEWKILQRGSITARGAGASAPRFYKRLDYPQRQQALRTAVTTAGAVARSALDNLVAAGEGGMSRADLEASLHSGVEEARCAVAALEAESLAIEVEMSIGGEACIRLVAQQCAACWLATPFKMVPGAGGSEPMLANDPNLTAPSGASPVFYEDRCFVPSWRRQAGGAVHEAHVLALRHVIIEVVASSTAITAGELVERFPALPPHEVLFELERMLAEGLVHGVDLPASETMLFGNGASEAPTMRTLFVGPYLLDAELDE